MINDTSNRFSDLEQAFFFDTPAHRAVALLDKQHAGEITTPNLFKLLRHHDEPPRWISDKETRRRDAFDYLLEYYGILEIASLIAYVPASIPTKLKLSAKRNLGVPALRKYYNKKYPQLLPQLFRLRVLGKNKSRQEGPDEILSTLFAHFLVFVDSINNDDAVERLSHKGSGTAYNVT
jgi:hypothetical protein